MNKNFPYCKKCRDWKNSRHIPLDSQCKFHQSAHDIVPPPKPNDDYAIGIDFAKETPKRPSVLHSMLEALGAGILAALFLVLLFAIMIIQPL